MVISILEYITPLPLQQQCAVLTGPQSQLTPLKAVGAPVRLKEPTASG